MYGNKTKEEIEEVINEVMSQKKIDLEYFNEGRIVKVSSEEMTLVGPTEEFDSAMIEVANEYIGKNKYKQ